MRIADQGTVCRGRKGTAHSSCAFPGLCVLPNGRWLCFYRAARTKSDVAIQTTLLTWSDDEGKSWSPSIGPFIAPSLSGKAGRFRAGQPAPLGARRVVTALYWVDASDPGLPFFNEQTQGLLDSRIMLSFSEDNGETWSSPRLVDTSPFRQPTPITGPILLLPDGRWILQFELNKPYDDPSAWRHSSVLMFSRDEGRSWPEWAIASHDPANRVFYWDQRPGLMADGSILDLFWTYDRAASAYLNIHARRSRDNGRNWSALWDTGVPGQPAPPVSLPDGRIAMVYVDRTAAPVIKLRMSADGGDTWPGATEMSLYQPGLGPQSARRDSLQEAWAEMERFSLGLPATAALPGGDILVVFYAGPEPDLTDIRWLRLRP